MDFHHLVNKSLDNYDQHQKFLNYVEGFEKTFSSATHAKKSYLALFDTKTKEKIFESEIQYLAIFYSKDLIWSWAWSLSHFIKETSYVSRKLLNYGLDLTSDADPFMLRHILVSSRLLITEMFHIDVIIALAREILKSPYIVGKKMYVNGSDDEYVIVFYIIVEVDQMKKLEDDFNEEQLKIKKNQII
jgi:hypothetical protein